MRCDKGETCKLKKAEWNCPRGTSRTTRANEASPPRLSDSRETVVLVHNAVVVEEMGVF